MSGQSEDKVHTLIENSKQLIAQLNELLAKAGAPIRFQETSAEEVPESGSSTS